jgi:hypothetical protein
MAEQLSRRIPLGKWGSGQPRAMADLVKGAFATLLLSPRADRPTYVSVPVVANAVVFENKFGEYSGLFPALADQEDVLLGDVLLLLGIRQEVRLLTQPGEASEAFVATYLAGTPGIEIAFAENLPTELRLLTPRFFLSGNPGLTGTPRAVDDVLTYAVASNPAGAERIALAYLEFDRRWKHLRGDS